MADRFSSANKDISITGASRGGRIDPKAMLAGMTKDVRKRWLMVGIGSAVAISVIAGSMSGRSNAPSAQKPAAVAGVDTTPKGISSQKDWRAQAGAEMHSLKESLKQSQDAQQEMLSRLTKMQEELAAVKAGGLKSAPTTPPAGKIDLTLPPPPAPPKSLAVPPAPPTSATQGTPGGFIPLAPVATAPQTPAKTVSRAPARGFIPPSSATATPNTSGEGGSTSGVDEMALNEKKGLLLAGSFSDATLISGVEAFTGGTASSQPQPLVIRLDSHAVLPNAAKYQVKGCHVLASVWGDMSSERVFGRLATLTCTDMQNNLVLSEEVEGTLIDSDGKNGIRGVIQDRQGAKLARSLLAGFAEGVSAAFGTATGTVSTTALGTTTSILGKDVMKKGAYGGAETAASQLADFYLKQAEATLPVIAVDAGRKISVVFTRSKSMSFETTGTYRVKPKDKLYVERP